ncbi:NAD(P)H-dependent oxidoreductase [Celerinatantimonas yamalensis]|uniref:NAD(P)H-dependent oxidoreductase n=1 Tax=Celerinatantimonas yamalensis TaxID=559956 RepID=A0ABW9G7G9_9GAMM
MPRILVIFAHPALHKSQANQRLLAAIEGLPGITIRDLYQRYPNGFIDALAEQALLKEYDILVFQHPFYWYSAPALLKEWMDLVLTRGYVYAETPDERLSISRFLSVITSGGSMASYQPHGYNRFSIRQFLLPFEQTATLCGMEYLPPFVVDSVNKQGDDARLADFAKRYRQLLEQLRDGQLTLPEHCYYLSHPDWED